MNEITVKTIIAATINKVWQCWTQTEHITEWNFAGEDWHCPKADNSLVPGGEFHFIMAAKDGSASFDFWGTYIKIETEKFIEIILGDGRKMSVTFEVIDDATTVTEKFEPEEINTLELQKAGWQAILDNFKKHAEG
ncbi:MAG: SRPBCC domain-containing protein [Bacteroidetes bacterium]|nr:SRPBCC domain-containing protein [Bacteroidota bacterium]